jgi:hypothetical protein
MNDTCENITHAEMIDRGFTAMYTVKPHHACVRLRARTHTHTHTHTQTGVHTLISNLCKT